MTAAYQDKRITILDEGITVGDKAFTMNLVNHASVLKGNLPLGKAKTTVNSIFSFCNPFDDRRFIETTIYHLVLDIAGNADTILSSKDEDYIRMLAGLINTFKGYTPQSEPEFDYEGEVLE
jgi:hypothetical protein